MHFSLGQEEGQNGSLKRKITIVFSLLHFLVPTFEFGINWPNYKKKTSKYGTK